MRRAVERGWRDFVVIGGHGGGWCWSGIRRLVPVGFPLRVEPGEDPRQSDHAARDREDGDRAVTVPIAVAGLAVRERLYGRKVRDADEYPAEMAP